MAEVHDVSDTAATLAQLSWVLALAGALAATGVGLVVVVGGLVDWSEGNVAARTLWGVIAMAVSALAPAYLAWLLARRSHYAALSPGARWAVAIAVPIALTTIPIGLIVLGYYSEGPILIR